MTLITCQRGSQSTLNGTQTFLGCFHPRLVFKIRLRIDLIITTNQINSKNETTEVLFL